VAASPSPRSPLRLGGLALLGVGVVAALGGLITTVTQGDGSGAVAQTPVASQVVMPPAPPAPVVPPPPVAAAPSAGALFPGATASSVPGAPAGSATASAPATAPAVASGSAGYSARSPLRVYNNSLITGLAAQAADDFRAAGWTVTEIGGFPGSTIPTSTAYYRPGTEEEAAAQEIGRAFNLRVEPRFPAIEQATPGVIVIVTREYHSPGKS
jgi:LytR cell envelope-related transcriptional attenuator